jgi:hypothetical protein
MLGRRACGYRYQDGRACGATPLRDSDYCVFHDPAHSQEVAEGRRLGGLRRRREVAVSGAYDFNGLGSVEDVRRLIEIAAVDALSMENSIPRIRAITQIAQVGARLLETGELADRLAAVEAVLAREGKSPDPFAAADNQEAE